MPTDTMTGPKQIAWGTPDVINGGDAVLCADERKNWIVTERDGRLFARVDDRDASAEFRIWPLYTVPAGTRCDVCGCQIELWWTLVTFGPSGRTPRGPWHGLKAAYEALERFAWGGASPRSLAPDASAVHLQGYRTRAEARDGDISDGRRLATRVIR